jgi:hypothetical protein
MITLINIFNNIRNSEEGLYRERLILLNKLVKYIRLFVSHLITEIILILAGYINNKPLNILLTNDWDTYREELEIAFTS